MKVTIQLDLKQLEALLNVQNPEVMIEVRQSILQAFAEKHIKGIANSGVGEEIQQMIHNLRRQLDNLVAKEREGALTAFFETNWRTGLKLKPEIREEIRKTVQEEVRAAIQAAVAEESKRLVPAVQERFDMQVTRVKDQVDQEAGRQINAHVRSVVEKKLAAVLDGSGA